MHCMRTRRHSLAFLRYYQKPVEHIKFARFVRSHSMRHYQWTRSNPLHVFRAGPDIWTSDFSRVRLLLFFYSPVASILAIFSKNNGTCPALSHVFIAGADLWISDSSHVFYKVYECSSLPRSSLASFAI